MKDTKMKLQKVVGFRKIWHFDYNKKETVWNAGYQSNRG